MNNSRTNHKQNVKMSTSHKQILDESWKKYEKSKNKSSEHVMKKLLTSHEKELTIHEQDISKSWTWTHSE